MHRTTQTKAGLLEEFKVYRISYSCDTPGPEIESGTFNGYWNGEVDTWGKLTICNSNTGDLFYLFPREIISI